jgi:hypothetical protein
MREGIIASSLCLFICLYSSFCVNTHITEKELRDKKNISLFIEYKENQTYYIVYCKLSWNTHIYF